MENLSKTEKKALVKIWKKLQDVKHILDKEKAQSLFDYLKRQLKNSGCDDTLRHTEQWLVDNVPSELQEMVLAEIIGMGGFCDCEVLHNCYEDYDIE